MGRRYKANKPIYYKHKQKLIKRRYLFLLLLIPLIVVGAVLINRAQEQMAIITKSPSDDAVLAIPPTPAVLSDDAGYGEEEFVAAPEAFEYSDPNLMGFSTYIMSAGEEADAFEYEGLIRFPDAYDYSEIAGVLTYRGNNYRNASGYGDAKIETGQMRVLWTRKMPEFELSGPSEGTYQPLIVRWPADIMSAMDFRTAKKGLVQLTEVIFADKSGTIYFMDIDDGELTRTPIPTIAYSQGTPSLDPRGYPILYVGQTVQDDGDVNKSHYQYLFAINLISQKEVFRFGSSSVEPFSDNKWQGYGGSPLVYDDHIIIEGESGVLYMFKMDAEFDMERARLAVNESPDLYKYKYENKVTGYRDDYINEDGEYEARMIDSGTTGSLVGYKNYVLFSDRSGYIQCIDMNHMALIYAVDIDGNGDFTLSIEADEDEDNGEENPGFAVYSGTRLAYAENTDNGDGYISEAGTTYFRRINGLTGKIEWENKYECTTSTDFRGGLTDACVLGENDCASLVYYGVVMEGTTGTKLYAVNKSDGKVAWIKEIPALSASVPSVVYNKDGKGYIVFCDANGYARLFDGLTGDEVSTLILEASVDGSPAVYGNKVVVHLANDSLVCIKVE